MLSDLIYAFFMFVLFVSVGTIVGGLYYLAFGRDDE